MKKIFLAILLLGSIVPVSQFHAKTDELICLNEPDSWFKQQWNSFLSFWKRIKTSPENSSHEVLRVPGYDPVRGYKDDVFSTDDRDAKDQFKIDCYRQANGNVVLDKNRKTTDKLDGKKINSLEVEKQKRIDEQEAAKKAAEAAAIDTWIKMIERLVEMDSDIHEIQGKSQMRIRMFTHERKNGYEKPLDQDDKRKIKRLVQDLQTYYKDSSNKKEAAYHILGFEKQPEPHKLQARKVVLYHDLFPNVRPSNENEFLDSNARKYEQGLLETYKTLYKLIEEAEKALK
jgi:hypothetical protein